MAEGEHSRSSPSKRHLRILRLRSLKNLLLALRSACRSQRSQGRQFEFPDDSEISRRKSRTKPGLANDARFHFRCDISRRNHSRAKAAATLLPASSAAAVRARDDFEIVSVRVGETSTALPSCRLMALGW